ncbi:TIGR03643 family protein [Arcobacter roscoffensis]|uniref:TIGR03643 family protein n=1 Tax=Arcobacter roscoffensis TaxID=2961520 RepID=A0ABY5DYR0_9BACT|nr:TIGR03643 family protein [Arcobacter roscoffensis]UTJ05099.1 TIGR03643 family protein [Arcobacter roscoffensis]
MYYKKLHKPKKPKELESDMQEFDDNRLIEMAWQDRTTFDAIYLQYGLTENQVKKRMKKLLSKDGFKRWRKRVHGRATKHKTKVHHKPDRFQGPW